MTQIQLIAASLRHRKLRTALLTSSVAVAIAVVTLTSAVVRRISGAAEEFRMPAVMVMGISNAPLPQRYVDQLAKMPGVNGPVEYYRSQVMKTPDGLDFILWAASDGWAGGFPKALLDVPPEAATIWRGDRQGLLVTPRLMRVMNWKVGQTVSLPPAPNGLVIDGRISGVFACDADTIIMHYQQFLQLTKGTASVRRILVPCDPGACEKLPETIDATFENSSDATDSMSQKDFFELMVSTSSAVPDMLIKIGILLVFVTIVVTMSTINTSLRERAAAIGALRVLGFTRMRTMFILTGEAIVLALLAGALGAFLPLLLFHSHGIYMGEMALTEVKVSLQDSSVAFVVAAALGLIVGLPPAVLAIRRDILRLLEG